MRENMMMDLGETIGLLRAERRRAIDAYQFQKAKMLENQITQLRSDQSTSETSSKRTGLSREFQLEKETLRQSALYQQTFFQDEIIAVRRKFQDRLEQLRKGHVLEMSNLAVEFSKALELESTRGVPESANLFRISKLTAGFSKYELADQLHEEAVDIQTKTIGKRQADTYKLYETREETFLQRHQNELLEHDSRFNQALESVRLSHRKAIAVLRQKYITHATKCRVPDNKSEMEKLFAKTQLTDDLEQTAILPKTPSPRRPQAPSRAMRSPNFPAVARKSAKA
jgi:hypothetical protein